MWAKVLPEVKQIQKSQKLLNGHLRDVLPNHIEPDHETERFDYRRFTEHTLSKYGLLDIIDDPNTTEPVQVAITFDGAKISRYLVM
jgi:hypothetical protein